MYNSFEEGLLDRRNRLQRKIRKQDIGRRITERRQQRLAMMDEEDNIRLVEGLPHTINKIAS